MKAIYAQALSNLKFVADCAIKDPDSIYAQEFFMLLDETFVEQGDYKTPVQAAAVSWLIAKINELKAEATMCQQNTIDIAHAFSDLRRFIEAKWMIVADLPSEDALLRNGPEIKHEVDALIAGLNKVASFYEDKSSFIEVTGRIKGQKYLINIDAIESVDTFESSCNINCKNKVMYKVKESYEEIKRLINA